MEQYFQQFLINYVYENIGFCGPCLEITARNQIFWRDGELYRASAALELPYTTTGDWGSEEGLFVAVGDQSLRQDLSKDSSPDPGASLVGYKPGITVEDAIDGIKQRTHVSSEDFPSIEDALNSGEAVIHIPNGVYEFSAGLNITSLSLSEIRGDGNVVFDFSNSTEGMVVDGGLTPIDNSVAIPVVGESKITFPTGVVIEKGDILVFWNPDAHSFSQYRTYYRDGFMAKVSAFDENSGVATLLGVIPECNFDSIATYKFNSKSPFAISGVKIIPPNEGTALKISARSGVYLGEGLTIESGGYT